MTRVILALALFIVACGPSPTYCDLDDCPYRATSTDLVPAAWGRYECACRMPDKSLIAIAKAVELDPILTGRAHCGPGWHAEKHEVGERCVRNPEPELADNSATPFTAGSGALCLSMDGNWIPCLPVGDKTHGPPGSISLPPKPLPKGCKKGAIPLSDGASGWTCGPMIDLDKRSVTVPTHCEGGICW